MPAKHRIPKRRTCASGELTAWSGLFDCGYDYFNDLEPFGFYRNRDADREARAAAPEAWKRLGKAFLETWQPTRNAVRQVPWALEEFGKPWEKRSAD